MRVIGWTRPSPSRPTAWGAPASAATSPSPVPSTMARAMMTIGPDLVSKTTPSGLGAPTTPVAKAWSSTSTPASSSRSRATSLKTSGSNGTTKPVCCDGGSEPPARSRRSSSRRSTPCTTGSPGPWSAGIRSAVSPGRAGLFWVWKDIRGITSAAVALPPRKACRSTRITSAPASAAPRAAPRPAGPPPTTSTSHSAATVAVRGASVMVAGSRGRLSGGTAQPLDPRRASASRRVRCSRRIATAMSLVRRARVWISGTDFSRRAWTLRRRSHQRSM